MAANRKRPVVRRHQGETWRDRERRLIRLGYRAMAIGFTKAHLGRDWMLHFGRKADRLFDLSLKEWRDAKEM